VPSRVRNHVLEERSLAFLRDAFPNSWVIHPYVRDYGIDIQVEVFTENGDRTGVRFYAQVKATDRTEDDDLLRLDRAHFDYWTAHTDPVVLLRYFDQSRQLRWCWMHSVVWLLSPQTQSLNVAELLKTWEKSSSPIEVERYLRTRKQALFESITPPYAITVERIDNRDAAALLAANLAIAINSKSFRVLTKDLAEGMFHVVVSPNKIAASHCGLPGFVVHYEGELTDAEMGERSLLAIFLCACRYERALFARSLATSIAPILYRAASERLKAYFFDAMIFALGLKLAAEYISELIATEEDPLTNWSMFVTACAASSIKYDEAHSWHALLRQWIKIPPIPGNAGAFAYNLGNSLSHQGQWTEACDAYASAIKSDANYKTRSYFWIEYGAANFESGNFETATRCYEKAVGLEDSASARWRLGDALFHAGQYKRAEEQFRIALPKLDSSAQSHVELLLCLCDEILNVWGVSSQDLADVSENDVDGLKSSPTPLSERDVILRLQPLMEKNAIDAFLNFNAGVLASQCHANSIAAYRFLTCALKQRGDAEAWTNSVVCALVSGDSHLGFLIAKSAHFYLGERFLSWALGLQQNSPKIPQPIAESWRSLMIEFVRLFELDRATNNEAPVLRIHGPTETKEVVWSEKSTSLASTPIAAKRTTSE
jgi:tetratricopeptide (TPR) repeat protein